jgi:hypothetical protein
VHSCLGHWLAKVCCLNLKEPATSSHGICGYISVLAAMKFTYFLIKTIIFCLKYRENSLIGDLFIRVTGYLIKKNPVPTKQAIIITVKFKSCNALLLLLLVIILSYPKLVTNLINI